MILYIAMYVAKILNITNVWMINNEFNNSYNLVIFYHLNINQKLFQIYIFISKHLQFMIGT